MWTVIYHPEAEAERLALKAADRAAVKAAVNKLESEGPILRFPHQSKIKGNTRLRELRPRAGRCLWRPLYCQVDVSTFVVAGIAPEAMVNKRGFARALMMAERRVTTRGS